MRYRLTLTPLGHSRKLPINYQYELASWIYKVINYSNEEFARFLHNQGYGEGNKKFKHFTFSGLDIRPFRLHKSKQQIEILSDTIILDISFWVDRAAEEFIKGLFMNQQFGIGDRESNVDFEVTLVESLPPPEFQKTMNYKLLSPLVISRRREDGTVEYLHPDDEIYPCALFQNLENKVRSYKPAGNYDVVSDPVKDVNPELTIKGSPRSKLIKIKAGTREETRVKGYIFPFQLTSPVEWHEAGYHSGFGELGSMGFGMGNKEN